MLNRRTGALLALIIILLMVYGLFRLYPDLLSGAPSETSTYVPWTGEGPEPIGPGAAYLKGAHWFGDGWAVNFWNTRLEARAAEDFATIRADGFNTVVIVVPWPGFVNSPASTRLVKDRARRLGRIVDLAGEADLNVVLRVGYAWDSQVALAGRWLMRLWFEEPVRRGWLAHIEALWKVVEDKPHVRFAFLSWEDLWAITGLGNGTPADRLNNAVRTGYRTWLQEYSDLDTVRDRYGVNFSDWNEVPIPQRMEPAFGLFFDFIDHAWIQRFFKPAQAVFPTMSMEIRIDSDPVWNGPGDLAYWHSHELAWDLPGAPWTTVYWSPAMGSENNGSVMSPGRAAGLLEYQMNRLRAVTGNRPIFVDQFLVEDFTPGFEMNDRIARDKVGEFLELAEPVLRKLTHGYALWAWRDYEHNAVTSPDFSSLRGNWKNELEDAPDAESYRLAAGQTLQRGFGIHEFHAPGGPEQATLCFRALADGNTSPDLLIRSENLSQRTTLDASSDGEDCVDIPVTPLTTVAVEALVDIDLTFASFSGFLQPIGMRDVNGEAKPAARYWQRLNQGLTHAEAAPFMPLGDGWMGKALTPTVKVPRSDQGHLLKFRTHLPASWPFNPDISILWQEETLGTAPCIDDQEHTIVVPGGQLPRGEIELTLIASRTWRPDAEERRLGCVIQELEIEANPL